MDQNETNNMSVLPINGKVDSLNGMLEFIDVEQPINDVPQDQHPNFIESNTQAITLEELESKCIVPTFSDNNLTISHQNFIKVVCKAAETVFGELTPIECRVSHPIIGRVPSALTKTTSELTEDDKTLFYQRIAWVSHVQNLARVINNQVVHLCIGGVRAYNEDKLYNRKSPEKYRIFVGWQVRVCSNLMLTCKGNSGIIECMTEADIFQKSLELFSRFQPHADETLTLLENLNNTRITETQFCNIIGRMRLMQALPTTTQNELQLPSIDIGDQAVNAATRNYVSNPNFGLQPGEDTITCFQLMQIFNEAVKASYIDKWLDRNQACTDLAIGISEAISGNENGYNWFLN